MIKNLKLQAKELLQQNKVQYQRVLLIILLINSLSIMFNTYEGISIILQILTLTISHGCIVISIKSINNDKIEDKDAIIGITRIKELYPTYFLIFILQSLIPTIILILIIYIKTDSIQIVDNQLLNIPTNLGIFIIIISLLYIIITYIIGVLLFAVPYIIEEEHLYTLSAIKKSIQLMKKHILQYIRLEVSFIGWFILFVLLVDGLNVIFSIIPLGQIISVSVGTIISVYTFLPTYHLSKALFYQSIKE